MYAIVDIETTGSHPDKNGITEIAIILHNGKEVEGRYETLINPGYTIPAFITHLTGISNEAVAHAPRFADVALNIHNLLANRIFIAHNVNFDFTFIKYHLALNGYHWLPKKLCTLKLSRKAFPGQPRYGLGHLCRSLEIPLTNRHRAGGDADATALLFHKILTESGEKLIYEFLKKENHEQTLPPNLPSESVKKLPLLPGVYYFHDNKGKIVYVGKAKNIRKRVLSHFTGLNTSKRRQDFLRCVTDVTYTECPTELTAFILESIEIKKHWPQYNVSQKKPESLFCITMFEDQSGYHRLAIDKLRKHSAPLITFAYLSDAYNALWKLVKEFYLHPALCFLERNTIVDKELLPVKEYNSKVEAAIQSLKKELGNFAIIEAATTGFKKSCVLVEDGKFYGMGLLPRTNTEYKIDDIKQHLTIYPENEVIRSIVKSCLQRNSNIVRLNA